MEKDNFMPKLTTEILLTKQDGKTPFVTKKGKSYYIEKVKYTDDINILLNAIKNVKPVEYNDLFKGYPTKEEYWQVAFNLQWKDGGLILWHNPTEYWLCEQTRKGKSVCSECGNKLEMYYVPYCPICTAVKKEDGYYNLFKMIKKVIATNGNFDYHDYAPFKFKLTKSRYDVNRDLYLKWEEKNFPEFKAYRVNSGEYEFNEKARAFFQTMEGAKIKEKVRVAYQIDPEGACKEYPYWNYWHFLGDYLDSIGSWGNDTGSKVNWKDVREFCKTSWQREITDMFIKEFGTKTYPVWISW